jgi:hypothetical protein
MVMLQTADARFDAVVMDRDNHAIILVEARAHPVKNSVTVPPRQPAGLSEPLEFVLNIDPSSIDLYRSDGGALQEPLVRLDTREILQFYDREFHRKRVFESYLLTLVEAWLRDLAYQWKFENPPGSAELERVGLLERLQGGTTQRLGA